MSLINDVLRDLDKRNLRSSEARCVSLREGAQNAVNMDAPHVDRSWSIKSVYVSKAILMAVLFFGSIVLVWPVYAPSLFGLETSFGPIPQQSSMGMSASPGKRNMKEANVREPAYWWLQDGVPRLLSENARLFWLNLASSGDSRARQQQARAVNESGLVKAILPRYIMPATRASSTLNAGFVIHEERKMDSSVVRTHNLLKDDHRNSSTKKDYGTAPRHFSPSGGSVVDKSSFIEVIRRPLSVEQQLLSDFHVAAGAYKKRDFPEAERLLKDLMARDSGQHKARLLLARLYLQQNLDRRAELLLYDGLLNYPQHAPSVSLYAQMLAEQGRDDAAMDAMQNALPGAHGNAEFHALLAGLYQRTGNSIAAIKSYRVAVGLEPTRGEWWIGLGISSEQAGDEGTATRAYKEALQHTLKNEVGQYAELRLDQLAGKTSAGMIHGMK